MHTFSYLKKNRSQNKCWAINETCVAAAEQMLGKLLNLIRKGGGGQPPPHIYSCTAPRPFRSAHPSRTVVLVESVDQSTYIAQLGFEAISLS